MKTIQEMAREAEAYISATEDFVGWSFTNEQLKAFAKLVREEAIAEANAKANASWTLMCEKMVAIEREACARVCETEWLTVSERMHGEECAIAIRARGQA